MVRGLPVKRWLEHKFNSKNEECGAMFSYSVGVCAKGPSATVKCDAANDGSLQNIRIGCGCAKNGLFMQGKVLGLMAASKAKTCSAEMSEWSRKAEANYMRPESAELCTAMAIKECTRLQRESRESAVQQAIKNKEYSKWKFDQFQTTLSKISEQNKRAQRVEQVLRDRLGSPTFHFAKIPGLGLVESETAGSPVENIGVCKSQCNGRAQCKAFSFNPSSNRCLISDVKLDYDADFALYVRSSPTSNDPSPFKAVPGLKLISDESQSEGGHITLAMCQNDCVHSDNCKSISYDIAKMTCVISQVSVRLGSSWDYYEKGKMMMHTPEESNYFSPHYMHMERRLQTMKIKTAIEQWKTQMVEVTRMKPRVRDVPRA